MVEFPCALAVTRWLMVVALLLANPLEAQPTGPLLPHPTLSGAAESNLDLSQGPELLELAARSLSRIHVELENEQQTVIVEEGVNVNIDCLPWQSNFPGAADGMTDWFFQPRQINGSLITGKDSLRVTYIWFM